MYIVRFVNDVNKVFFLKYKISGLVFLLPLVLRS